MTIHKKLFKVKTIGTREEGNLKPILADYLPKGIHLASLQYNEAEKWAIVLCWCSDHELLPASERHRESDLIALASQPSIIEVLPDDHPLMPKKPFTSISLSETIKTPFKDEKLPPPLPSNEATKTVRYKNREWKYLRKRQYTDTDGRTVQEYILEE